MVTTLASQERASCHVRTVMGPSMPGINYVQRNDGPRLDELFCKNGNIIVPSAHIVLSRDDQDRFLYDSREAEIPR